MTSQTAPIDLRSIPKVELHRHLECSLRYSTFKELAPKVGLTLPASDAEIKREFLVTEPMRDLESVLKKFLATRAVLNSEEILTRITYEAIEDAHNEGIRILELRYAPTFIQGGHPEISFEKSHRAILKGVEMAKHLPVAVGLIVLIQRILPVEVGARVGDFAIDCKDTLIGVDLADNEQTSESLPFAAIFQKARKAGLHVTIHAGEDNFPGAPKAVRDAIEYLGAERIGHGLQIHRSPEIMKFVRERNVVLELCPTSNWLTNAVPSKAAHPFRMLMESGVPVSINSDDPGVFDIDLVNEYHLLATEHRLTHEEFDRCNDTAAAMSFIARADRERVWPRAIAKAPWE